MTHFSVDKLLFAFGNAHVSAKVTPWGYMHEVDLGKNENLLVKVIRVNAGFRTSLQFHERKDEVLLILEGEGHVQVNLPAPYLYGIDDGPIRLMPGRVHRAVGPLLMLEVSTRDPDDVVRLEDDYGRK